MSFAVRGLIVFLLGVFLCSVFVVAFSPADYSQPRDGFSVSDRVEVVDTAVYSTGFYSVDGSSWSQFSLQGESFGSWVVGSAQSEVVPVDARYFAVFSCSWSGSWDCSDTWQVLDRGAREDSSGGSEYVAKDSLQGDFEALMDLYAVTDGDNWRNNSGWGGSVETMGDWWGVATNDEGRVIHLDLQRGTKQMPSDMQDPDDNPGNDLINAHLIGEEYVLIPGRELPESLGNLRELRYLNLKQNVLRGPIPQSLARLENLERLLLSGQTREPGTRPQDSNHPATGVSVSGKHILATNQFNGSLPEDIGNLRNLEVLQIDRSELSGSIPESFTNLSKLKTLLLIHNDFEGSLDFLMGLESLVHIQLSGNEFSGEIPRDLGDLSQLAHFRFSSNNLHGEIPRSLERLTDLRAIHLQNNQLSGSFPDFLFDGEKNEFLITLILSNNNFSGVVPDNIDTDWHWALNVLHLSGNNFEGPLPNWMSQFRLIQFQAYNNNFEGPLPPGFFDSEAKVYDRLRYLQLQNNKLSGPLPNVTFANNRTSGTPRLWRVAFQNNNFEGEIPSAWADITTSYQDFQIFVHHNNLSGEIPLGIASIDGLLYFYINDNKFSEEEIAPLIEAVPDSVYFEYANQQPN